MKKHDKQSNVYLVTRPEITVIQTNFDHHRSDYPSK